MAGFGAEEGENIEPCCGMHEDKNISRKAAVTNLFNSDIYGKPPGNRIGEMYI